MLKTIQIDAFDPKSFQRAVGEIGKMEMRLRDGLQKLCEKLLDEGVQIAKMQLMSFPAVDTGALMASIGHGAFDAASGTGVIYAGAYYAFFVEYGTGSKGAEGGGHPASKSGDFAVLNSSGTSAYTGYSKEKTGWAYMGHDGQWHYTHGMAPRPFMYNTLMELADKAAHGGGEFIGTYIAGGG